nr:unnamed protein product [Naegleria fowleri]
MNNGNVQKDESNELVRLHFPPIIIEHFLKDPQINEGYKNFSIAFLAQIFEKHGIFMDKGEAFEQILMILPKLVSRRGIPVIMINMESTSFDKNCVAILNGKAGEWCLKFLIRTVPG